MKGIMMSVNMKTYVRYHAYVSERSHKEMHRLSQLAGKSITTQTIILDMENLSSKQMGYKPGRFYIQQESSPRGVYFLFFF